MILWLNLLGKKANVNTASYRILSILIKQQIATKIISLDTSTPYYWSNQINNEIRAVPHVRHNYAIISKVGYIEDEELRYINNYIRRSGIVIPRAFYVCDRNDKTDYMKNYKQINHVFNIDDTLDKHKKDITMYTDDIHII